jgi:hypothetical protein
MLTHNLVRNGQPETRPVFLRGEERIEDPVQILLVDPASMVVNINTNVGSIPVSFQ